MGVFLIIGFVLTFAIPKYRFIAIGAYADALLTQKVLQTCHQTTDYVLALDIFLSDRTRLGSA